MELLQRRLRQVVVEQHAHGVLERPIPPFHAVCLEEKVGRLGHRPWDRVVGIQAGIPEPQQVVASDPQFVGKGLLSCCEKELTKSFLWRFLNVTTTFSEACRLLHQQKIV